MKLYSIGEVSFLLGGTSKEKIKSLETRGYVTPLRVGRRKDRLFTEENVSTLKDIILKDKEAKQ